MGANVQGSSRSGIARFLEGLWPFYSDKDFSAAKVSAEGSYSVLRQNIENAREAQKKLRQVLKAKKFFLEENLENENLGSEAMLISIRKINKEALSSLINSENDTEKLRKLIENLTSVIVSEEIKDKIKKTSHDQIIGLIERNTLQENPEILNTLVRSLGKIASTETVHESLKVSSIEALRDLVTNTKIMDPLDEIKVNCICVLAEVAGNSKEDKQITEFVKKSLLEIYNRLSESDYELKGLIMEKVEELNIL